MTWLSEETVNQIAQQTIEVCPKCKPGARGIILQNGIMKDCDCVGQFRSIRKLVEANIPRRYWNFDFRNVTAQFRAENQTEIGLLSTYMANIGLNIAEANWLFIQGGSGLAKTAITSYILRTAINAGYLGYQIRLSHLTELHFLAYSDPGQKELLEFLQNRVQIVGVEEMDKDSHVKDSASPAGSKIAQIFGDWYDRGVAVVMTSNTKKDDLSRVHHASVIDRVNEAIDIVLTGASFRSNQSASERLAKQMKNSK